MSSSGERTGEALIDRTRYAAIRHQLAMLDIGKHAALFYQSKENQYTPATAYIDIGLQNGERCLYIHDESDPRTLKTQFRSVGIDVDRRLEAGELEFVDGRDFYLSDEFDPHRMVEKLQAASADALDAGYEQLRVIGENTWSFELQETFDSIIEFEAQFDQGCTEIPANTLCTYNLERFDEAAIVKALRTHEHLIYRDTVCENPFYIHPEEYIDTDSSGQNAVAILEQTYQLSESRQAVRAQEQRLEVINRIFRHNIRNDMNILLNHLEYLESEGLVAEEGREELATMKSTLKQFIDTSERARYIEKTLRDSRVTTLDLVDAITAVTEDLRAEFPDAEFDIVAPETATAIADENFRVAIEELLRNAVVHSETDAPTVEVTVAAAGTPGSVRLAVTNDGTLPEQTRNTIETGVKTQLQHSSGLGLWLVKWLVEQSHGTLRIADFDDRCRIQVDLPTTVPSAPGESPPGDI